MSNWNILNKNFKPAIKYDAGLKETSESKQSLRKNEVVKSIAVIGGLALTSFIIPTHRNEPGYDNTIVAKNISGKEFEVEKKMVSKDTFDVYKELIDERSKVTNDKIDSLSKTINKFITEDAITKNNLFNTIFSGFFAKTTAFVTILIAFLTLLEKLGIWPQN